MHRHWVYFLTNKQEHLHIALFDVLTCLFKKHRNFISDSNELDYILLL